MLVLHADKPMTRSRLPVSVPHRIAALLLTVTTAVRALSGGNQASFADEARVPNIVFIMADEKY